MLPDLDVLAVLPLARGQGIVVLVHDRRAKAECRAKQPHQDQTCR